MNEPEQEQEIDFIFLQTEFRTLKLFKKQENDDERGRGSEVELKFMNLDG